MVIAFENGEAVGCGAFKPFEEDKVEMKRMFVKEEVRGKKIASKVLKELEQWAKELGFHHFVLEIGIRQEAAISFYH